VIFVAIGELHTFVLFILYVVPPVGCFEIRNVAKFVVIAIPLSTLVSTPPFLDTQNQLVSASSFSKYAPLLGKSPNELSLNPSLTVVLASFVLRR